MWKRLAGDEGQAAMESAVLLAALATGAMALGWPLARRLLDAWSSHEDTVRTVIELPLP
ncbi:hypothetical protein [Vulgatibacter sp.]|uniref:hypothetical protein n=1 Tax=Vulgatibacter sp. TaxID=1971226 RepID=UPI0035696711